MQARIDDKKLQKLEESVEALQADLKKGKVIYGEQDCLLLRKQSRWRSYLKA